MFTEKYMQKFFLKGNPPNCSLSFSFPFQVRRWRDAVHGHGRGEAQIPDTHWGGRRLLGPGEHI